ncbi:MAG: SCP2 sterol-binding domain-containing protein [Chloroflexi bacterium]|nr:SCP2 sterol-binding domain-containing protein [Chloroflexota bacterium]
MPRVSSVAEVFAAMPQVFVPENAAGVNAVLQFDISGEGGGQWNVTVADKQVKVAEGAAASPTMVLAIAAGDYLAMINGESNPMNLFMQGKIKLTGDMQMALKMQSMFKMA